MAVQGEEVHVINCEKAVYSGKESSVLARFKQLRERTVPLKGPYFPTQSDKIVRRAIRGMISYKTPMGKEAFARVKCSVGTVEGLEDAQSFEGAKKGKLPNVKYVTIKRISEYLGGNR